MLWPVYLWSAVQQDHVRLFELGDVLTLPVELVDAAAEVGWPAHVGVETAVTVTADANGQGRWVTTPAGLSVRTQLSVPVGSSFPVRAGLTVDFQTTALISFVTGTVRRIEMASVPSPKPGDPAEPVRLSERWTLTETPVAPVRFRYPLGSRRSKAWDQGILIHLELFKPHCRCTEIGGLQARDALDYAQRHLRATAEDHRAGTIEYVCPDTGITWLWHRWKRKRYLSDLSGVAYEPMILTQQPSHPDSATSEPLPDVPDIVPIAISELTGSLRDVAQLTAEGASDIENAGLRLVPIEPDEAGPVRAAALQLAGGSQYLLVQHLGHPEQFIDVRATTDVASGRSAADRFLTAAAVPDAHVLWRHDRRGAP
jgi:hypothetical protein